MSKKYIFFIIPFIIQSLFAGVPKGYSIKDIKLPKGAVTVLGVCQKDADTMAICTWEGEVWEQKGEKWTKFAENLMDPNGIYYEKETDSYFVAQKPELTRIKDLDGDGVADLYENITDRFGNTSDYHEYHFGPVADSLGRKYASLNTGAVKHFGFTVADGSKHGPKMYYTGDYRGWVYRSDRQGHFKPFASGVRSPAGIGMSPSDELFVTDNQGDWLPASAMFFIREGGFYGHPVSLAAHPDFDAKTLPNLTASDFEGIRRLPAIWFPRDEIANSPGSPVWDTTNGKFGIFKNQIFVGDQRLSNIFRCDLDWVGEDYQGFCVNFLDKTKSGTVKMAFDSQGRLWTGQVGRGWASVGGNKTGLQVIEWDGKGEPFEIYTIKLTPKGFRVVFTEALNAKTMANFLPKIKSWHYTYSSTYGSPPMDVNKHAIKKWTLSKDGKVLELELPLLEKKVFEFNFEKLKSAKGEVLINHKGFYTLNKLKGGKNKMPSKVRPGPWTPKGGSMIPGSSWRRNDKTRILPSIVTPLAWSETVIELPENALVLDKSQWTNANWVVDEAGVMSRSKGNNETKQSFGTARFHVEFMFEELAEPIEKWFWYGNSGLFLMGNYELQMINSYENPGFADGECGALYGQVPPMVNASRPPGEWQSYDVLMKEPTFAKDGNVIEPLRITVFHNGRLIHNDESFLARITSAYKKHGKLPLVLQDHKGTAVSFRNIWAVEAIDYDADLPKFLKLFKGAKEPVENVKEINLLTADALNLNKHWVLKEGELSASDTPGGILWSKDAYGDFEITLEYKTSEKCNSGLFFRTNPSNPVQGGFEIQIASDGLYGGKHIVGSLFDAKESSIAAGKPDGEWNKMKVTCKGPKVSVVLNGKPVLDLNLDDWNTPNKNPDGSKNKFKVALKDLPRKGHFGLQYHGQAIWYRNVKLKVMDGNSVNEDAIEEGNPVTVKGKASARGENQPNEMAQHAFDGNPKTKWLDFSPKGSWIQYDFPSPIAVSGYAITSAFDAKGRDPKDWQLLGSNDGKTWSTLDTRSGVSWDQRTERLVFHLKDQASFKQYRIKITRLWNTKASNSVQIGEIQFLSKDNVIPSPASIKSDSGVEQNKSRLVNNLDAGKKQTVVAFGTSLTAVGAWVDQVKTVLEQQYPGQVNVINGAQGGANSAWGRKALDKKVLQHKPDTVFIEFAVNDAVAKRKTSVANARGNLENIIERILKVNPACEIILMVMNRPVGFTKSGRPNLAAFNQMYRDVAKERKFQLIDHYPVWEKLLNDDPRKFILYTPDTIHPVRQGALNVITPTIVKEIGLKPGKPELSGHIPCWTYLTRSLIDKDKKGGCTREEFDVFWTSIFNKNDADSDGQLQLAELESPVLFKFFDADKNGQVSLGEYLKVYAPHFQDYLDRKNPSSKKIKKAPVKPLVDTFTPYKADNVPQNVTDLWKDYDPRKEPLDVKVIKEWKTDGVVTRYITYKVGTFKGADARVAAYYSFPEKGSKHPAFVWSHGGGQRAERSRGVYFAKHGFATIDINWLGRPMEEGIDVNTDWGNVDPTQGPRFYSKAKRKGWKRSVLPDEYTIDPVPSARNNNWFLLVVAGKRAITFLEKQPEVNAEMIGFTGFSMGGTITSMIAMDSILKAVAPFVGGTANLHVDFPGIPSTSIKGHYTGHLELYGNTVDPGAYWPLVKCPVMFISSSNDFHSAFDRIYQSMDLLPHDNWRVSTNIHENHGPNAEQWILVNKWFNLHLKGTDEYVPATPKSQLLIKGKEATFTVTPENQYNDLKEVEIYYSYDPNSTTRFWIRAEAKQDKAKNKWSADLTLHSKLPLYTFAICRYSLGKEIDTLQGNTSTFTVNSTEQFYMPKDLDLKLLSTLGKSEIVEDFSNGIQDWSYRGNLRTYKFQNPLIDFSNKNLSLTVMPNGKRLTLRLSAESKFLGAGRDLGSFSYFKTVEGDGLQNITIRREEFKGPKGKKLEWSKISRFGITIIDSATKAPIDLSSIEGRKILKSINMIEVSIAKGVMPENKAGYDKSKDVGLLAPKSADLLFDGTQKSIDENWGMWPKADMAITWKLIDGIDGKGKVLKTDGAKKWGTHDLVSKKKYKDFEGHVDFMLMGARNDGKVEGYANSGVYLQNRYEIQIESPKKKKDIADPYNWKIGNHGIGAFCSERVPDQNAWRPNGQWQSFHFIFTAAKWDGTKMLEPARATVWWNGLKVHNNVPVKKANGGVNVGPSAEGLKLQEHGQEVHFCNVWIKERN